MNILNILPQTLRHFLWAWVFFTKIPLPQKWLDWADYDENVERACLAYLPIIGIIIGTLSAFILYFFIFFLNWKINSSRHVEIQIIIAFLAVIIATIASILCTGALHEDGLADVADALGGGSIVDKNRILAILKDPHLGVFAVLTLGLNFALNIGLLTLLAVISPLLAAAALASAHIFSRLAPVILLHALPYVGNRSQAKSPAMTAQKASRKTLILSLIFATSAPLLLWAAGLDFYVGGNLGLKTLFFSSGFRLELGIFGVILWSVLILRWLQHWFQRRLGGITGDCLGAGQQIVHVAWIFGVVLFIL